MYERVDVDTHLTTKIIVENIPPTFQHHRLAPNTSIHYLWVSKNQYFVGSIVAIVTSPGKNNIVYDFTINYGESTNGIAIVSIYSFA